MVISVALPDVTHAQGLVQRLGGALEATVSIDVGQNEIRVLPGMESNLAVLRVVDIVEDWLEQRGVPSAKLSLGERSCTLFGSGQIASSR
jgi:hypothetical protein